MAPEYGATMGFFPVDQETLGYLQLHQPRSGLVALVEAYTKEQGLFRTDATPDPLYADTPRTRPRHRDALDGRPEAAAGPRRTAGRAARISTTPSPGREKHATIAVEWRFQPRSATARW